MKNILFISTRDYNFDKEEDAVRKKFLGLSKDMAVYVLARGRGWRHNAYRAEFFLIPKLGTIPWMITAFFRGWYLVWRKRIDIIVSQAPLFDGLVAVGLKYLTRRRVIIEVHSDWINSLPLQHNLPVSGVFRGLFRRWGRFVLNRADKVRTVSRAFAELISRESKAKDITVFPAYTDLDIFLREEASVWRKKIVYVGWLYRLKGAQDLIEAFGRAKKPVDGWRLVIVGDGPYRKELEAQAQGNDYGGIEFTGWLDLDNVKEQLKDCSTLVLPSYSEGLPRVLPEAAALGKMLIGSRVGGIPEVINDGVNGLLFQPGNKEELRLILEKVFNDPKMVESMGRASRKLVEEKFSVDGFFENYRIMINH